ncbi:hypothetical protein P3T76_005434 [Phytophthora citrophthora]|uniref:Crinkler (CRN) family protein n=1 Tax=Phytophthora citrophthora TaxID=4793 RepID=A0AAD9GQ84_9STRA|nr:hypothetical protein P3T76_005434 [Phytophthora citrophthora]
MVIIEDVLEDMPKPRSRQIHLLVVCPETIVYSWRPSKPLVGSAGASWEFQNPLDVKDVSKAIQTHYNAWKKGISSKTMHPLFTCISGPGTGKSRMLDKFPAFIKGLVFPEEKKDANMLKLLQDAYTFKITFDKVVTIPADFEVPGDAIGTRMLYQLQDSLDWETFCRDKSRHCVSSQAIAKLSEVIETDQREMCVILCVDNMQNLQYESRTKTPGFYYGLGVLGGLVNASKCWFIAICSGNSIQSIRHLPDCQYPLIQKQVEGMRKAFLAVMARRRVDEYSRFGELSLDEVISTGLVRLDLEEYYLTCPNVLYLLLGFNGKPSNRDLWDIQNREEMKPWQSWELLNCKVRELKVMAWVENDTVRWDKIHGGARVGFVSDRDVLQRPLTYTVSKTQMDTRFSGFIPPGDTCSCGSEVPGRCVIYQPAAEDPSSTAFTCVEDVNRVFFHEVHQCKVVEGKVSLQTLKEEKAKVVGPDDIFVFYCTGEVEDKLSWFENYVVVDRTCWEKYYGPFAARAWFASTVHPSKLSVGPEWIEKKRPISSFEDDKEETKITTETLKKLKLNVDEA